MSKFSKTSPSETKKRAASSGRPFADAEQRPRRLNCVSSWLAEAREALARRTVESSTPPSLPLPEADCSTPAAKHSGDGSAWPWSNRQRNDPGPDPPEDAAWTEALQWIQTLRSRLHGAHLELTQAILAAVKAKDPFVQQHSLTVSRYCRRIAAQLGLNGDEANTLQTAALLHDVGKIGVPDEILKKVGPLSAEEYEVIKEHPVVGVEILEHTALLNRELPVVLCHHERYDGSGYPSGLVGEEIPLLARVLNVADALEAMLSHRRYKQPYSLDQAREELVRFRCRQFDPTVVDATLAWLDEGEGRDLVPGPPVLNGIA